MIESHSQRVTRRDVLAGAGSALIAAGGGASASEAARGTRKIDTSPGEHVLKFDMPGLRIGSAVYPEGPTGCTVFHFPKRARGVVDIRGGAPATFWTDAMRRGAAPVDAICLTGGSLYGLESVAGVAGALMERKAYSTHWDHVALVSGAVIYDYGARPTEVYPDRELGRAALAAARPGQFPLGGRGAGASATCGKWLPAPYERELAGQGGAFERKGELRVAVFTVVNSVGVIVDRKGRVVRGHLHKDLGRRIRFNEAPQELERPNASAADGGVRVANGNTTLTLLVTNQKMADWPLSQLARQVHTSMARAIQPFHTLTDGDVLYVVSTDEVGSRNDRSGWRTVAELGSRLAWDAVLASFAGREVTQ